MKNKKNILIIVFFLILQTIIYIFVAKNKSYLHIDEAYSFGLTNYDKIEIQDNKDFYDTWHSKEYYEDYLAIQEDEKGNYKPVYENQKNDVHPPLYYLLLRFCMEFSVDHVSIWPGIILNIIIYVFITIFMYLILRKLLNNETSSEIKAITLAFISSITLASLSTVINIRMYALSTLNITITTFLHMKLFESNKANLKLLMAITINSLCGVLTHYYYLFYLVALYLIFLHKYIKEKRLKQLLYYTLSLLAAGVLSLLIFPYSIQHMFFGYRGQGVISSFKNISEIFPSIFIQICNINRFIFSNTLPIILIVMILLLIYNKKYKKTTFKITRQSREMLKIIYIPTIFFFLITSIASPWKVLRYFAPVCGLIFILIIFYLYKLMQFTINKKMCNILISIMLCIILISPFVFSLKPELLYDNKKEIVQQMSNELNLPTIYCFNSKANGFLSDIFIFSKLNESYIAKDIQYTESNIKEIVKNKNISKGILIFINDGQNNQLIIDTIKQSLNLTNCEYLQKLSSCDAYYIH